MDRETWEQEKAELQEVIDQLATGKLSLEHGQNEYLAGIERRIAELNEMLMARSAA